MNTPQFFIDYYGPADSTRIYFRLRLEGGQMVEALACQLRERIAADGEAIIPMLEFHGGEGQAALQSLMDELWRNGVRPKDIGTAGHLAATTAHLNDMRAIVQKTLDVQLP